MNIEPGRMVPLGYGKYVRSDRIVGLEPIEDGRGPGQRTKVYVEQLTTPIIASRSEGAILSNMVEMPREITNIREQRELFSDLLDTLSEINPLLRSIIRDQGQWDLDRVEERIRDVLRDDDAYPDRAARRRCLHASSGAWPGGPHALPLDPGCALHDEIHFCRRRRGG